MYIDRCTVLNHRHFSFLVSRMVRVVKLTSKFRGLRSSPTDNPVDNLTYIYIYTLLHIIRWHTIVWILKFIFSVIFKSINETRIKLHLDTDMPLFCFCFFPAAYLGFSNVNRRLSQEASYSIYIHVGLQVIHLHTYTRE